MPLHCMLFSSYYRPRQSTEIRELIKNVRHLYYTSSPNNTLHFIRGFRPTGYADKVIAKALEIHVCLFLGVAAFDLMPEISLLVEIYNLCLASSEWLDPDIKQDIESMICLNPGLKKRVQLHNDLAACLQKADSQSQSLIHNLLEGSIPCKRKRVSIPKTGFFSFLEHIVLLDYFAEMLNMDLLVDCQYWPYPIPVESFYHSKNLATMSRGTDSDFISDPHLLNSMRCLYFTSVSSLGPSYCAFKALRYRAILDKLTSLLCALNARSEYLLSLASLLPVLFVRRGDKIATETISPSLSAFTATVREEESLLVLSDDFDYATKIIETRGSRPADTSFSLNNIPGYSISTSSHSIEAFLDVTLKWICMSLTPRLYGCPSANIVNTACSTRPLNSLIEISGCFYLRPPTLH